jgi:hypothetical protein
VFGTPVTSVQKEPRRRLLQFGGAFGNALLTSGSFTMMAASGGFNKPTETLETGGLLETTENYSRDDAVTNLRSAVPKGTMPLYINARNSPLLGENEDQN